MSFKAELLIEGRKINLLYVAYDFRKQINKDIFPVTYPQSGFVTVMVESQADTFLLEWALSSTQQKSGSIIFYKRDNISKMRELIFTDAYCVFFREKFSSKGVHPMFIEAKFSAGELRYGTSAYKNPWFETEGRGENEEKLTSVDFFQPGIHTQITEISKVEIVEIPPAVSEKIPVSGNPRLNSAINSMAVGLVSIIPTRWVTALSSRTGDQSLVDPSWDGKILSCSGCNNGENCSIDPKSKFKAPDVPGKGKGPFVEKKGACKKSPLEKIYYINGIQTIPANNCKTSKKLANTICAEVLSIYNRTEGITGDVYESARSLRKSDDVPPTDEMEELIQNHFGDPPKEPYEPLTLYAHSQGGLITQQALIRYKNYLNKELGIEKTKIILKNIKIKSFGTAEQGWPDGPEYEQFTNEFDPIPQVIKQVQNKYKQETYTEDTLSCKIAKKHTFAVPFANPINAHSMDNVYIDKLKETRGTIKDKCKICPN